MKRRSFLSTLGAGIAGLLGLRAADPAPEAGTAVNIAPPGTWIVEIERTGSLAGIGAVPIGAHNARPMRGYPAGTLLLVRAEDIGRDGHRLLFFGRTKGWERLGQLRTFDPVTFAAGVRQVIHRGPLARRQVV